MLHKRYQIIRTIGQGGMGAVYQAKDLKRQMICAVKEMSLSMVTPDERPQAIQNFKVEAKMLWGLSHPNLPAFTGFFSESQRYFMVMEYIDGYTLEEMLERNNGPFPERRVLGWARQLCDVLEYLHSQKPPIIFRDMKPGNIMLTRTGRIKLIDFGIARFFRSSSSQDTQLLGTPGFAPPEQYGKSQTDERSDIYSLAITLFQMLTDTLSENGFGLKDVRAVNPRISQTVARALEKAASLDPDDRYENVAAFKRALLGVGTFQFENGDQATTPGELADLCTRYPEEASDYLEAGEIELWLQEIGEVELARTTRRIRSVLEDPEQALEQFIQAVVGPKAHTHHHATQPARPAQNSQAKAPQRGPFSRPVRSVIVSPRTLDFGQVYPGITAPVRMTISGNQGMLVRGLIRTTEPWILIDQTQFDAMTTHVNVRVNSTLLRSGMDYSGAILISPDEDEDGQQEIVVPVEADVLGFSQNGTTPKRRAKTHGADLDDDEDDDMTMGDFTTIPATLKARGGQMQMGVPIALTEHDEEYKKKYGPPGTKGVSSGWEPLQTTPLQRLWMQRGFTFSAALMLASLFYTLFSHLPGFSHALPLPPDPWFGVVLAGIIPSATLGALLVNWNGSRRQMKDLLNRGCSGMATGLVAVALIESLWEIVFHNGAAPLQLLFMLCIAALSVCFGISRTFCDYIIYATSWVLVRVRQIFIAIIAALGGLLGLLLGTGLALSWATPINILVGIGIGCALVLRVDHLMQQQKKP